MKIGETIDIEIYGLVFYAYKSVIKPNEIYIHLDSDRISNPRLKTLLIAMNKYGYKINGVSTLKDKISMLFLK